MWMYIWWSRQPAMTKYHKLGNLFFKRFFLSQLQVLKVYSQDKYMFNVWWRPSVWFIYGSSWYPHVVEGAGQLSGDLLYKGSNVLCKVSLYDLTPLPLWPNLFPTFPWPNAIYHVSSTYDFSRHKHSDYRMGWGWHRKDRHGGQSELMIIL